MFVCIKLPGFYLFGEEASVYITMHVYHIRDERSSICSTTWYCRCLYIKDMQCSDVKRYRYVCGTVEVN